MPLAQTPTVCLTFDFDALSVWLSSYTSTTPAVLSRGEFGPRVGLPRVLDLLARYSLPATFFVPGHKALEIWTAEFDYMLEREPNGVFTLTLHPQVIGRGHRIAMLKRFVEHVLATRCARFARLGDVARSLAVKSDPGFA